jgi:hypothetical protein
MSKSANIATDDKDAEPIRQAYSIATTYGTTKLIDSTYHKEDCPIPDLYGKTLSDSSKISKLKGVSDTAAKMVHDIKLDDNKKKRIMSKSYYSGASQIAPGWSTITTKSLYNAAGIGALCEEVYAHDHQGIPTTVHVFADNKKEIEKKEEIHPESYKDLQKIIAMDFLTDNQDRHVGNLLIDSSGKNPLAIDHEMSFGYSSPNALHEYKTGILNSPKLPFEDMNDFGHWWKENSNKIKKDFERNLIAVKDQDLRVRLRHNFTARAECLDKISNDITTSKGRCFHYLDDSETVNNYKTQNQDDIKKLKESLPTDSISESANIIADWASRKGDIGHDTKRTVQAVLRDIVSGVNSSNISNIYKHFNNSPSFSAEAVRNNREFLDPRIILLRSIDEKKDRQLMDSVIGLYDEHPNDELLGVWSQKFAGGGN